MEEIYKEANDKKGTSNSPITVTTPLLDAITSIINEESANPNNSTGNPTKLISNNFYQKLAWAWNRADIPTRMLLSFLLKRSDLLPQNAVIQNVKNDSHLWLTGAIPVANKSALNGVDIITSFTNGASLIRHGLWPVTLFGFLGYDIYQFYNMPENRFGNTLPLLLEGLSPNESVLSAHFGSYLPSEITYWLAPSLLIGAPVIMGGLNGLTAYLQQKSQGSRTRRFNISPLRLNQIKANFYNDTLRWIVPFAPFPRDLAHAEFSLLWSNIGNLEYEEKEIVFKLITKFITEHGQLAQLYALSSVANIVDSFAKRDIAKLSENEQVILKSIRQQALTLLVDYANYQTSTGSKGVIRSLYANYLLWTLGQAQTQSWRDYLTNLALHPIFWAFSLYSTARFWEIIALKAMGGIEYFKNKKDCDNSDNVWTYIKQIADYECTVCGDWPSVYYPDMLTSQGCLDNLLRQPLTADEFLAKLPQLLRHPESIKTLDLSKQNISEWSTETFQKIFTDLRNAHLDLTALNLSTPMPNPFWPNDGKIEVIADYLAHSPVQKFDMSNQKLGSDKVTQLMQSINGTALNHINLTNTDLKDEGIDSITSVLQHTPIQTLIMPNNDVTDMGVAYLSANGLKNSTVTEIVLSDNAFSAEGVAALSEVLPNTSLEKVELNNVDLSQADFQQIGQSVAASKLKQISLSNINMSAQQAVDFAPFIAASSLESLDVSNNLLSSGGASALMGGAKNSTLTKINLNQTGVDDEELSSIKQNLPDTPITSINLSNNYFSSSGFCDFTQGLNSTQVSDLTIANNPIEDEGMNCLADAIQTSSHSYTNLDVENVVMTEQSAVPFVKATQTNQVADINLSNNPMSDKVAETLAQELPHNPHANRIILNAGNIGKTGGQALAETLSRTTVKHVSLDNNPIGSESVLTISKNLITSTPQENKLGNTDLSRDERRAIHEAKSNAQLETLSLVNTELDTKAAVALCEVLPRTNIPIENLNLAQNDKIDPDIINVETCQISAGSGHQPPFIYKWIGQAYGQIKATVNSQWNNVAEKFSSTQSHSVNPSDAERRENNFLLVNEASNIVIQGYSQSAAIHAVPQLTAQSNHTETSSSNFSEASPQGSWTGHLLLAYTLGKWVQPLAATTAKWVGSHAPEALRLKPELARNLSDKERAFISDILEEVARLEQKHEPQKQNHVARSGLSIDLYAAIEKNLTAIRQTLMQALKTDQILPSDYAALPAQIECISEKIHLLAQQNKQLKRIEVKERRLERQMIRTGQAKAVSRVKHNALTGELQQEIMQVDYSLHEKQQAFNNPTSLRPTLFGQQQLFWSKASTKTLASGHAANIELEQYSLTSSSCKP